MNKRQLKTVVAAILQRREALKPLLAQLAKLSLLERERLKLTQRKWGALIGVSQSLIVRIENGLWPPSWRFVRAMERYLERKE